MTSYFNACSVTVANSYYKNFPYFFDVHLRPNLEKGSCHCQQHETKAARRVLIPARACDVAITLYSLCEFKLNRQSWAWPFLRVRYYGRQREQNSALCEQFGVAYVF